MRELINSCSVCVSHSLPLQRLYSAAGTLLIRHRSFTNYTSIGTMGLESLDIKDIGQESSKVIGKAILTKISEFGVQKGTKKATGDGSTLVKIEEELKIPGGPIKVIETVDVKLSTPPPLKVDLQSVGTAFAVGILGGWIMVTLVDTVKGIFTGGSGKGGTPDPDDRLRNLPWEYGSGQMSYCGSG